MTYTALATTADLTARGIDITNTNAVTAALAAASAAVRDAAGVPISQQTSTVTLPAVDDRWLPLPGNPVTAIVSVTIAGDDVTADVFRRDNMIFRRFGWRVGFFPWDDIVVTFTHGLTTVPADIVDIVCALAAAGIAASTTDYAAVTNLASRSEAIDDYREQVAFVGPESLATSIYELPERTRRSLAARFGGGAYVVESRPTATDR